LSESREELEEVSSQNPSQVGSTLMNRESDDLCSAQHKKKEKKSELREGRKGNALQGNTLGYLMLVQRGSGIDKKREIFLM
jgi:hypothetical protein